MTFVNLLRVVEVWVLFRILPHNKTFIKPVLAAITAGAAALADDQLIPEHTFASPVDC